MQQNLSSSSNSHLDRVMTCEQFEQVVDAILSGKYSWACVLILRFAGYNPLHYIPYRTYNRLIKQHQKNIQSAVSQASTVVNKQSITSQFKSNSSTQLEDLNYVEDIKYQSAKLTGGTRSDCSELTLVCNLLKYNFRLNESEHRCILVF